MKCEKRIPGGFVVRDGQALAYVALCSACSACREVIIECQAPTEVAPMAFCGVA